MTPIFYEYDWYGVSYGVSYGGSWNSSRLPCFVPQEGGSFLCCHWPESPGSHTGTPLPLHAGEMCKCLL